MAAMSLVESVKGCFGWQIKAFSHVFFFHQVQILIIRDRVILISVNTGKRGLQQLHGYRKVQILLEALTPLLYLHFYSSAKGELPLSHCLWFRGETGFVGRRINVVKTTSWHLKANTCQHFGHCGCAGACHARYKKKSRFLDKSTSSRSCPPVSGLFGHASRRRDELYK